MIKNTIKNKLNCAVGISVFSLFFLYTINCVYTLGWETKSISHINASQEEAIFEAYGLKTTDIEAISDFFSVSYTTDKYYVIRIDNISDIETWCNLNESWECEKLDKSFMLFNNKRYASQRILIDGSSVYVSCLSENIPEVANLFFEYYKGLL